MNLKRRFWSIAAKISFGATLLAASILYSKPSRAEDTGNPKVFTQSYSGIEMARNFPVSTSEQSFRPGKAHPAIGYRYFLGDEWSMGLFASFRMLRTSDNLPGGLDDKELPILSIAHESARVFRLYHPTYLAIGFRVLYLMPATHAMLPTGRSKDFRTEFGAAATATFIHLLDPKTMLTLRVERWRGTGSSNYHGVEVAAGGAMSFD